MKYGGGVLVECSCMRRKPDRRIRREPGRATAGLFPRSHCGDGSWLNSFSQERGSCEKEQSGRLGGPGGECALGTGRVLAGHRSRCSRILRRTAGSLMKEITRAVGDLGQLREVFHALLGKGGADEVRGKPFSSHVGLSCRYFQVGDFIYDSIQSLGSTSKVLAKALWNVSARSLAAIRGHGERIAI